MECLLFPGREAIAAVQAQSRTFRNDWEGVGWGKCEHLCALAAWVADPLLPREAGALDCRAVHWGAPDSSAADPARS